MRQAVAAGASKPAEVSARFEGARSPDVAEVLDALAELGLVQHEGEAFSV